MSSHADTIRRAERVLDGTPGGRWVGVDLELAQGVMDFAAENERLREAAAACLLQWAQGRGIPPRLTTEEVELRDALGLDMAIFGDEHRRSLGPFAREALAGDAE